jgi:KaiC/GvpD/RAD55 family RecA-like ATPase
MKDEDMEYIRLSENYNNNILIPINKSPFDFIKNNNSPYFVSMMKYSKSQFEEWQKTNSLKGMSGGKTNKLWADFDCKENVELALKEAGIFAERLLDLGFKETDLQLSYSGGKGAGIIVDTIQDYTIDQVKALCTQVASGLQTFDTSMYDHQRIFRVLFTRNEKTGLYKIPLQLSDLQAPDLAQIKADAAQPENYIKEDVFSSYTKAEVILSKELIDPPAPAKIEVVRKHSVDVSTRPTNWKDYKWALVQGMFEKGERHSAMMVIAATCRGLGYDEMTTTAICQTADVKHCERTGDTPISDLEDNIIPSIFSHDWNGGQYSYENNAWLKAYCGRMGFETEKVSDGFVTLDEVGTLFSDYSLNFEKNIVKTGIPGLDENAMFLTSTHNGLLGQPGSGKTTLALQWLQNASTNGVNGVFYSMDMGQPIVYAKLIQREIGCSFKEAMNIFRNDPKRAMLIHEQVKNKYKNTLFNFRSGITVDQIKKDVQNQEQATGSKVKLLVIDYLECMAGPYSDSTANTAYISNQMKDLANELQVCSVMLLQTQKHSTVDISDPLLSMKQIKGSSVIEQSCSVILTAWREGYNPRTVESDRFMSFAVVKNRFGTLWSDDFHWNGQRGHISELTEEQRDMLAELRQKKAEEKNKDNEWS